MIVMAALLAGLGCSDYPDPYSDRCPTIWELEVNDITAATAVLTWETDRRSLARVRVRPPSGVERLIEDQVPSNVFTLVLDQLLPETDYVVKVVPAAENFGGVCGDPVTIEFRTRPVNPIPDAGGDPVPDPTPPPPLVP